MKIEVTKRIELPAIKLPRKLMEDIGHAIELGILDNIIHQRQADGSGLKRNPPLYADAKRRQGWTFGGSVLSLVAGFKRFIKTSGASWKATVLSSGRAVRVAPATKELADLSISVQQKGYTGWLGVSKKTMLAIKALCREWLRSEFSKMRQHG